MAENVKLGRDRRRMPRYSVDFETKAVIQLFGSPYRYELQTENISESGLLLRAPMKIDHLSAASILEVNLFINDARPIAFLAKWVRNATDCSIGIVISDIAPAERSRLLNFIESISTRQPPE